MKYFSLFVFFVITLLPLKAQTVYNSIQSGDWSSASTWDFNGVPFSTSTNDDQIIINEGHIISNPIGLTFYNTSSLLIQGELVTNSAIINLYDNSTLINNGIIRLGDFSSIYISNNSTLTNNNTILRGMYSVIYLSDNSTLFTCIPEPIDKSMDSDSWIEFGTSSSAILAPVPLGNPCDDGDAFTVNTIWDGDCGCTGGIAVPTLSQWGIIALLILLLTFGLVAVKDFSLLRLHSKV